MRGVVNFGNLIPGMKDGPILVAQAASWVMNSTLDKAWIDAQFESDPIAASAEYGACFRTDVDVCGVALTTVACGCRRTNPDRLL